MLSLKWIMNKDLPYESERHSVTADCATQWIDTGMGSLSILQGIFPTQALNTGLSYCRWILYHLSHKGSPTVQHRELWPMSCGNQVGGNVEGEGIHVHVWLNPFAITESYYNVVNQLCSDTK